MFDWLLDFFDACWWAAGSLLAALALLALFALLALPTVGVGCAIAALIVAPVAAAKIHRSRRVSGLVVALLGGVVAILWAELQRPIFWG